MTDDYAGKSIYDFLLENVERSRDKPALGRVFGNDIHWREWWKVAHWARYHAKQNARYKLGPNEIIATPCDEVEVYLGYRKIGCVLLPFKHGDWSALDGLDHVQVLPWDLPKRPIHGCSLMQPIDGPGRTAVLQRSAGTSGSPKTAMLTHENLLSNAIALSEASGGDGDELRLSFLPMEHLYARTCDLYTWIVRGSRLVLAESPKTVFRDAKVVKPTVINGVPYFFQKAIDLAEREGVSLKQLLGGEIKRCYCGGAPLAPSIEQRFFEEGVPLYNGYGLTEASPVVSVNTPDAHKLGTVGKPLPGVEVRIAGDGEVLVRGPNVMMGYWGPDGINRQATDEVIRDGWLHTGDLGELDNEGFLTITGRKKELLVLSTGKNVAPSRVEALLCASPWIEQACVVGEGRKGLRALIVPNPERLRAEIKRRRLWVWSKRGALRHAAVRALYREEIDARLAGAAKEEQVHNFALIGRGFEQERGEMTAKLSLRRGAIEASFERELAQMG